MINIFNKHGKKLYRVGGAVRDELLGLIPKDIDYCTNALPEETIAILKSEGFPVIPIGIEFGTVGTIYQGEPVEITTFRTDKSYKKNSRKPTVAFGTDLTTDLSRRDFTINAIATDGVNYYDPYGGEDDLNNGILRTPIDPHISFGDDPLRILRAARFIAKYDLTPTKELQDAARDKRKSVKKVSAERIFQEFTKLLIVNDPTKGLQFLADTLVIANLFPRLQECIRFNSSQGKHHTKALWPHLLDVVSHTPPKAVIRWAALFHDVAKPQTYSVTDGKVHFFQHEHIGAVYVNQALSRLKASTKLKDDVTILVKNHMKAHFLSDDVVKEKALRRFVSSINNDELVLDLLALNRGDLTSKREEKRDRLIKANLALEVRLMDIMEEMKVVVPKLPKGFGNELMKAGIPQGPELGRIMKQLTDMLIDGEVSFEDDLLKIALEHSEYFSKDNLHRSSQNSRRSL